MSALLIAGSPSERSRSAALLDAVSQRLHARGALVDRIHIRNLSPQALLLADFGHPTVVAATDQVAKARVLVVATNEELAIARESFAALQKKTVCQPREE